MRAAVLRNIGDEKLEVRDDLVLAIGVAQVFDFKQHGAIIVIILILLKSVVR